VTYKDKVKTDEAPSTLTRTLDSPQAGNDMSYYEFVRVANGNQ